MIEVGPLAEMPESEGVLVETGAGIEIAVFRLGDEAVAVQNECPHRGGPLVEGTRCGGELECPWHAWYFDLRTGKCLNQDAQLLCYPVRILDGTVFVEA
jgi:nitrite reductase/ring-hydroxylating ferredoxin subunit